MDGDVWKRRNTNFGVMLKSFLLSRKNYKEYLDIYMDFPRLEKSDLSRLLILHHHGGMYCDTDTIPIKRMDKFLELFDEYDGIPHGNLKVICHGRKKKGMWEFTEFEDSPMKHKK